MAIAAGYNLLKIGFYGIKPFGQFDSATILSTCQERLPFVFKINISLETRNSTWLFRMK